MKVEGYMFPPINPGIDPDTDWLIFERWMQGKPVRAKMKEQLASSGKGKMEMIEGTVGPFTIYLFPFGICDGCSGSCPGCMQRPW